jgi:hypothetical protein
MLCVACRVYMSVRIYRNIIFFREQINFVPFFFEMLLDCFASCTQCLSLRWERRAADKGEGGPAVPVPVPVEMAPETAPGAPQVPAADDANGPEPAFQIDLGFLNKKGNFETIRVTVDYSQPVNVVTRKCLKGLDWKPLKHALPSELSKLAAEALLAHCGWQRLGLYDLGGGRGLTRHIEFVVVGDDYHCDLLLGREFKGVKLKPRAGIYPIFKSPQDKGLLDPRV